jgi:glycosyltransferase involved in cell wall biosynthesis
VTRPEGRLRVLLVSANYRPSVGGVEQYVANLSAGLAGRGHEVTVLSCRTGKAPLEEMEGGVRIVRVSASDLPRRLAGVPYPLPAPLSLDRMLRRLVYDADVVDVQDALYLTSVAGLARARRGRVPSLITLHVGFVPQAGAMLDAVQHAAIATLGRSARLASLAVSYNPAVADWARARWGLRDVRVVAPGVPHGPPVDRAGVRRAFGLPEDRFLALFAGRDVPKKGLDVFLAAADPAYELVAVTDRAVGDGARFLPFARPEEFRALLAAVDAYVLPSQGEGFPLALQEALVSGLPCVVSPGPGYDHYLREGEAILVPRDAREIRQALRRLVEDEPYRRSLGERARIAGTREFGLDRFVTAYETLYAEVLEQRRMVAR